MSGGELTLAGRSSPLPYPGEGAGGVPGPVGGGDRGEAVDVAYIFGEALPCGIGVHYAKTMDDVLNVTLPDILAYRVETSRESGC